MIILTISLVKQHKPFTDLWEPSRYDNVIKLLLIVTDKQVKYAKHFCIFLLS